MRTQRNWSIEEDILLLSSVKELGHKWSKIAKKFVDLTHNSLRNRFKHYKESFVDLLMLWYIVFSIKSNCYGKRSSFELKVLSSLPQENFKVQHLLLYIII